MKIWSKQKLLAILMLGMQDMLMGISLFILQFHMTEKKQKNTG